MKHFAVIVLAAILLPSVIAAVTPERQRKSDYYYMEALSRAVVDDYDVAALLLRRAVELDSTGSTVPGGMLGTRMLSISNGDSVMVARGLQLLETHVAAHPDDLYSGYNLALNYENLKMYDKMLRTWQMLDSLNSDNAALLMRRASVEDRYGSKTEALSLLRRVETLEGISPNLTLKQAQLMLELGDSAGASGVMHRMLAAMPADADAYTFMAMYYDRAARPDSASVMLDRALTIDPAFGMAFYARATRLRNAGRLDEYNAEVARAVGLDDLDPECKMALLKDYVATIPDDDPQAQSRAGELFAALTAQYPLDAEIRRFASGYYFSIKDYVRAAENMSVVADQHREDPQIWNFLARMYVTADMMPEALATARTAVEFWPEDTDSREMLGLLLSQDGRYDEAIGVFAESLALPDVKADNKLHSDICRCMGDVWQQAGRMDSAVVYYEKAIAIDPDNDLALNNYAYYLADRGLELSRAEQMSSRSMMLQPGLPTYLDTYAWILFKLGEYQKASGYIDTALLRSGDNLSAELLEHAGDIAYKLNRREQAVEYWREALDLDPENERLIRKVTTGVIEENEK